MGNCLASDDVKRTRRIERQMREDHSKKKNKVKILLLGAGESGKSTFFKQMKLLYTPTKDFTQSEKKEFKAVIFGNIIMDAIRMITATETHTQLSNEKVKSVSQEIQQWRPGRTLSPEDGEKLRMVWQDPGLQATWADRGDIQVQDAWAYYMEDIERIASGKWQVTNADILRSRARTSGVVKESFMFSGASFEMYDVGGQRNERKKWLHHFAGVTTVLFIAAISEYNQKLFEDQNISRQTEAIELFKQQLEYTTFINTPFILFLNKIDLFREKLGKIPFRVDSGDDKRNVDFEGPHCDLKKDYKIDGSSPEFERCVDAAVEYLSNLYLDQSPPQRGADKRIFPHATNSTDSQNIEKIMNACREIILNDNLFEQGWL